MSGGLQENQGTRTDLTSVRNLTEADTKKELAKIAAKAKENQRLSEGAGNKGCQISDNLLRRIYLLRRRTRAHERI